MTDKFIEERLKHEHSEKMMFNKILVLEKQLLAEQAKNKELKQECNSLKMYKYWGEILEKAKPILDDLQEYLIKNQMFNFAQKLMFTRKENIVLHAKNKKLVEGIEKAKDIARTYQDYRPCFLIKQALNEVNK